MTTNQVPPPGLFANLYNRYIVKLDEFGQGRRLRYALLSLLLAAVLIALSSLTFLPVPTFVLGIIGAPAGAILFLNLVGAAYFTKLSEASLMNYKETYPPARRIRDVAIGVVVVIVALLVAGAYVDVPQGIGGALIVLVALLAYQIVRRTPEEIRYAVAGLPDPREIKEEDES